MKLTNKQLKQIIKEELQNVLNEMNRDSYSFNKRRNDINDVHGQYAIAGDESASATPHALRHKLYNMLKSGDAGSVRQAQELAKGVDDPLEVPITNTSTILFKGAIEKASAKALDYLRNTVSSSEEYVDLYDFNNEVEKRLPPNTMGLESWEIEATIYNWALDNEIAYEDYILIR